MNYSSFISSGDVYLPASSMESIRALVDSLHDTDNVTFEEEPLDLISIPYRSSLRRQ